MSEDAQGILQPRRHFCDLYKREKLLPSAVLGSNTGLHSRPGKTVCFPLLQNGIVCVQFPCRGLLIVDVRWSVKCCMDHQILGVICLLCVPSLADVLEKCLFFFYKKGAEVPGSSCCTSYTCVLLWGTDCTSCFEEDASC